MGICGQENQVQKIEKETNKKRDPETNLKIDDIENNSKLIPETNPKLVKETNIKIFTGQKEVLNKIKDLLLEAKKSICRIIIKKGYEILMGTGFFMKVNDSKKYLVTNYHNISHERIRTIDDILLHLSNEKDIKLNLKNRHIDYFQEIDITLIEIKDNDEIYNEIKFLTYDLNYILGYEIYKNGYVFMVGYPRGEESCGSCKIVNVEKYEFYHTIPSSAGSGGSPIMLLNDNIDEIRVIGIHIGAIPRENVKIGTFIAEILGEEKEEFINPEKNKKDICLIQFLSGDQHVNMFITCKVTDNFSVLEEKLYKDFPDLRNKNIIFLAKGNTINRSATLEENKIKNDTTILIQEM